MGGEEWLKRERWGGGGAYELSSHERGGGAK